MIAILKIVISPYLHEKSSDFYENLYTAADFELDERHVIKNEKVAFDRLRVRQNVFLVLRNTFVSNCLFALNLEKLLQLSQVIDLYSRLCADFSALSDTIKKVLTRFGYGRQNM